MTVSVTNPEVHSFFDEATSTITHIVSDPGSKCCAIIDSVLDYNPAAGRTSHVSADKVIQYIEDNGLLVEWILETHAHADHLTAAPYLKSMLGGSVGIGKNITVVQQTFGSIFNLDKSFSTDGSQFDHLFSDQEEFFIGDLGCKAIETPGHTPACVTYLIGDCAFVGDTLFMPDYGSARCDFPGGDASRLYQSVSKLLSLPADTRLFLCHDYMPGGREPMWQTTVGQQKALNIHIHSGVTEEEFIAMRTARDATLNVPGLLIPSIQVNIRSGDMPLPEENGVSYLKVPINLLD